MSGIIAKIQIPIDVSEIDGDGIPYRDAIYRDHVGLTVFNSHAYQEQLREDVDAVINAERLRRIERRTTPPAPVVADPVGELADVAAQLDVLEARRDVLVETVRADPGLVEAAAEIPAVADLIADPQD